MKTEREVRNWQADYLRVQNDHARAGHHIDAAGTAIAIAILEWVLSECDRPAPVFSRSDAAA